LNRGLQWPYQPTADLIGPKVEADVGGLDRTKGKIKWRLQRVRYPYPESADHKKSDRTFYEYVRNEGLLDVVLNPMLLGQIWMTWFFYGYYLEEKKLHSKKKSQYGHPMKFHRDAMKQIAGGLLGLEKLRSQNKVPSKWFAKYRTDALKALLREASIYYPRLRMGFKSASQFRPDKLAGDTQMDLFQEIQRAASGKEISDNFAFHLVALIMSSAKTIKNGKLQPMPSSVGKNIRDRQKKLQLGKSSKKPA